MTVLVVVAATAVRADLVEIPLEAMLGTTAQKAGLERGMRKHYENPCRDSGLYWQNKDGTWRLTGDGMAALNLEGFLQAIGADDAARSKYRVLLLAFGKDGRVPHVKLTRINRRCEPELSEVVEEAKKKFDERFVKSVLDGHWSDGAKARFLHEMNNLEQNPCASNLYYRRDSNIPGWWIAGLENGSVAVPVHGHPPGLSRKQAKTEYDVPLRDVFCKN